MKDEPVRILHIVQRLEAGGTQALLMNLYRNIDRSKVQFDFLVEYPNKEFYDDEVLSLGGKIYYSTVRVDFNLLKFKKYFSELLDKTNYKIIHMHMSNIGYICFKEAEKKGISIRIAHNHNNGAVHDWKFIPRYILGKLYTIHATDFFTCSKEAGEYRFKGKPYKVLKNGIDSNKFIYNEDIRTKIRNELNLTNNFVVGHIGRFHPQKNHKFLLEIFKEIKNQKNNAKLLLIGTGELEKEIREKVKELNIEDDVLFLGNRTDVNEIYQAMDVFVFPSLFEGLGIVSIEAQAAGTPILCSNNVPKEIEITPLCKKLSLENHALEWANTAIELSENANARKNMQKKIIESGFDIKDVAIKLQNFYLERYNDI